MATQDTMLTGALREWRALLGDARVLADDGTRAAYASSTAGWQAHPAAVLLPVNGDEVQAIVRIAAAWRTPLYPISTGRNWGYGDACAAGPGQVIVDLSRMGRILDINAELAYVVVEPGVTQQQLSACLAENGLQLWMDCTGAGPDTSLVGNILERGFGHSPYGNRLQHVSGMDIVLPDGELLRTGFGHYGGARNTRVFPYGIGPWLDGMFTQSNFGIVTSLGLWLMPHTPCINHFLCSVARFDDIAPIVDALRPLRLDGTLRSVVHIGNDMRILSGGMTYPQAPGPPLPQALRLQLCTAAGIGAWTISGALYGRHDQVACARRALRSALRGPAARLRFLDERKLALGARVAQIARMLGANSRARRLEAQVALGRALFDMNRGIPNGRFLAGAYWRRRGGLPPGFPTHANPARDNCGLLWVSPVLPMRGNDMLAVMALASPIYALHGFDLFATFSMITDRGLGGVLTVAYDKDDVDEATRAHMCYHQLFEALMEAGYIPYRVGLQSMADLNPDGDAYWRTVACLKNALDPLNIIAPGRYQPPP